MTLWLSILGGKVWFWREWTPPVYSLDAKKTPLLFGSRLEGVCVWGPILPKVRLESCVPSGKLLAQIQRSTPNALTECATYERGYGLHNHNAAQKCLHALITTRELLAFVDNCNNEQEKR